MVRTCISHRSLMNLLFKRNCTPLIFYCFFISSIWAWNNGYSEAFVMCFEPRFKRFIFCLSFTSYFKSNLTGLFVDYIRDFTDALILARQEAEDEEDKEVLSELTDLHLVNTISDIFGGSFIIEKKTSFFLF